MTQVDLTVQPHQMPFVLCEAQFVALIAGLGAGKSHAGGLRGLMASSGYIGKKRIPTPNLGIVTAATYPMLRDATLRTYLEICDPAISKFNKSEMLLTLRNGSEILFRSTENPERLRAINATWWHGDEAALYSRLVYQILIARLRQYGSGYAWLTTTPKGRNWIYDVFIAGINDSNRQRYRMFTARTRDNAMLGEEYITSLEEEYSGDFARQELEGEFVAFEGLIYPEFKRERHVINDEIDLDRYPRIIAGVDWGYNNPGVILVAGVDGDGRVRLLHEEYARRRPIEEWVTVAAQLQSMYKIDTMYCDPSRPEYIQMFREAGAPAEKADNRVEIGIQTVRQALMVRDRVPMLTVSNGAANTIVEFEQYQWAKNTQGMKDQPLKANDHTMDSLRYLMMGAQSPASSVVFETSQWA